MTKKQFGLPETAADHFIREQQERARLHREIFGSNAIAEAVKRATEQQRLLKSIDFDAPYRGILDTIERDRANQEALRGLTSTAWALSVQETARSIVERNAGILAQQRSLSETVLDTLKSLDANRSAAASAIAAANVGEDYRRIIAEALPRMTVFGAIAERMRIVDVMTLRAGAEVAQSATVIAAEMVIEAQRIAEAIADAPTDEESARLFETLIESLTGFFARLGPNTVPELQRMGLVGFLSFIITLASVYALFPHEPSQSPQDKAAFAQLNVRYDKLQAEVHRYHETVAQTDERYLADLPKAELARNATLRRTPERRGEVVLKAPEGTTLAIAKTQGHWRLVVYRDPLSNQLARAWVYGSVLTMLAAPLPAP